MRRITVGVMGSGIDDWEPYSSQVGQLVALLGYNLLTGGGGGVMKAVSKSFCNTMGRHGISIGVVPTVDIGGGIYRIKDGYPNGYVEFVVASPLGVFTGEDPNQVSRNHINIMSSDYIIALPGSKGTQNEILLANKFAKPLMLFGPSAAFKWGELSRTDNISDIERFITS